MFSEKPHDAAGHYSSLLKDIGIRLFKSDDKEAMYYTSSLALFRFEELIKTKQIDKKYSKAKYHAIMLLKYMFGNIPKFHNSKKMDDFCKRIQIILNDSEKCLLYFSKIVDFIDSVSEVDLNERKVFEKKETTDILLMYKEKLLNK